PCGAGNCCRSGNDTGAFHRHPSAFANPQYHAELCSIGNPRQHASGRPVPSTRTLLSPGESAMNSSTLRLALIVSLVFNFGVLGALGWQRFADPAPTESADPLLVRELQLNDEQRQRWQAIEEPFLIE